MTTEPPIDDIPEPTPAATPPEAKPSDTPARRWPRRVAIGVVLTGAALGTAYWYLGRETTLQTIVQKVANASGGKITVTGVSGSLYGAMHIKHAVYRTPEQVVTIDNIDIDWSPWQYLSRGIAIKQVYVARVHMQTLKEGEPAKMPVSLAPPFTLAIDDARIGKLIMAPQQIAGSPPAPGTEIDDIRFRLHSDKNTWILSNARASTPWGLAQADGSIGTARPFKLDAKASLSQSVVGKAEVPARMDLRASGDLENTLVAASGKAGRADGTLNLALAPFAPIPLRSVVMKAKNLNPDILAPNLPTADLSIDIDAGIRADRSVSGHVNIVNAGPFGTIDAERLPLRALQGRLDGNLNALRVTDMLADFGAAGKFTGSGSVERGPLEKGPGTIAFALHTDRLDLRQLHGKMKVTAIAGDIRIANDQNVQTLSAKLADKGMRLDVDATMAAGVVEVQRALLAAGASQVSAKGMLELADKKNFKVAASTSKFNPADFGDYPAASINLDLNAAGALAPQWQVAADFNVRPSRVLGQDLSGRGKLAANARHVSNVNANLALGKNSARLSGAFGAPGEKLNWEVDGHDLSLARPDLVGTVKASGAITGTMELPRTSFVVDANGLGMGAGNAKRVTNPGTLHASGTAALGPAVKDGPRTVDIKASGNARAINPGAFGVPLTGSINGDFDASGSVGGPLRGTVNLALAPSTLNNAPLTGHARISADARHVSNADVDLRVGPNLIAAKGAYGLAGDKLDWRIDAPQLGVIGPDFGGVLRGAGTLTGSMAAPALSATLDGAGLRLPGGHAVGTVRASVNVGAGRGGADPVAADLTLTNYTLAGEQRLANARLVSTGTRAAHGINLTAQGPSVDVLAAVRGSYTGNSAGSTWNGTIAQLQNKGLYAFTLQAPATLRIAGAPGSGIGGLIKPNELALSSAVIALPAGQINIASLAKQGPRWTSRGNATGVPLQYLAQFSPAIAENLRGDLALGGEWSLDMQAAPNAGAAPVLKGMVYVFREKGDVIAGSASPVVLGLRTLDLRADVERGALRMQAAIDGERAGNVKLDATASMINGRLGTASPLRLTANADMGSIAWLAPLANQPGLAVDGALRAALTGGGTIGQPTLNGTVTGDKLSVRWPDQGVRLQNGQLRANLAGDQLILQRLSFDGNQGNAVADGTVRFADGAATMNLKLVANGLEALSRPDRTVVLSGQAALVRDATRFAVTGDVKVDRALIELAPQGRPTLSSDVIVLGRTTPAAKAREKAPSPLTVDLGADLGRNFRLRGMGLDARLAGELQLRMAGGRPPRLNGGIRVVNGTYKAYGQNLTIERGVLTFSGPLDNPSLNVLAVRKRPEGEQLSETNVEAGVQVRGTALAPQAKLVSTPNVPDSEKLSWLVLGHGMEGTSGSDASVLSAAAGALLGGGNGGGLQTKVADALGLDELGLSQAQGLESTVVTIGKRISSRAYLTFEQGASTATSLVKLRYRVNRRITLQFQTGTNTALDVLYSWAWD